MVERYWFHLGSFMANLSNHHPLSNNLRNKTEVIIGKVAADCATSHCGEAQLMHRKATTTALPLSVIGLSLEGSNLGP